MTAKGGKQTAPRRVERFNREEASPGAWQYNDPDEEAFIFAALPTIDVSEVDDFLEGLTRAITTDRHGQSVVGAPVALSDEIIEALLERRQDAFDAFKVGNDDLMEARLDALSGWCHFVGFRAAARPDIEARVHRRKAGRKARLGKPGTADDPNPVSRLTRNERIYIAYKRLTDPTNDEYTLNPTQKLAADFEVSDRQIRRIVADEKKAESAGRT